MGGGTVNDMMLRQYIDQVFMRYDFNRTGTLNLPELHVFLNELFMMCGLPRRVSYTEAFQALMAMDANRDGQINKFELFNLFHYINTPGFRPVPYSYGGYSYGGMGMGMGGMGMGGMGMGSMGMGGMGMGMGTMGMGMGMGGVGMGYGGMGVPMTSTTYTTVNQPMMGGLGMGGVGMRMGDASWNPGWSNFGGGW